MRPAASNTLIRPYVESDAAATLEIFRSAISETAAADYSPAQLRAWIGERDLEEWHRAMTQRASFVATVDGSLAGFSDVNSSGYIDMMYVAPALQRHGVAAALLREAERRALSLGADSLTANVSITAMPFFGNHGFTSGVRQTRLVQGVLLSNFPMKKPLLEAFPPT